jgi:hypothetical protein
MSSGIEIYVRPSGDRVLLNIYVPKSVRNQFIEGLRSGSFGDGELKTSMELSVLPQWITESEDRVVNQLPMHIRVPISAINFQSDD